MRNNIARRPKVTRKAAGSYHHGDLRGAMIRAVLVELEKTGPESISLTAISKKLGVSQPSLYRHFADREELLSAVAVEGLPRIYRGAERGGQPR